MSREMKDSEGELTVWTWYCDGENEKLLTQLQSPRVPDMWTALFSSPAHDQVIKDESINKYSFIPLWMHLPLTQTKHCIIVEAYKPHTIASVAEVYLLTKSKKVWLLNSILIWEKLHSTFPLIHSYTVCATSRLVLSLTSSVGHQQRFEFEMTSCNHARKIYLETD